MITQRTYIIPVVVHLEYQDDYIDKEAHFIASCVKDKLHKLMRDTISVKRWSVDLPNETNIKLK